LTRVRPALLRVRLGCAAVTVHPRTRSRRRELAAAAGLDGPFANSPSEPRPLAAWLDDPGACSST
jgi:hypothetical protein